MASGDFRDRLLACLGGEWPKAGALNAKVIKTETLEGGIRREKISYDVDPEGEDLPGVRTASAYLLAPAAATRERPAPAICVWHQHNGAWHLGASEPAG